jgi:hypothetical protein
MNEFTTVVTGDFNIPEDWNEQCSDRKRIRRAIAQSDDLAALSGATRCGSSGNWRKFNKFPNGEGIHVTFLLSSPGRHPHPLRRLN